LVDGCISYEREESKLNSRPEKIVNLLSAVLVLFAGSYVIIFLPLRISVTMRILIGLLLIIYFLIRIRVYLKKYPAGKEKDVIDRYDHNKSLDKDRN